MIFSVDEPVFHLYGKAVDSPDPPEPLLGGPHDNVATSVSPDSRWVVVEQTHPETGRDLLALPLDGERMSIELLGAFPVTFALAVCCVDRDRPTPLSLHGPN